MSAKRCWSGGEPVEKLDKEDKEDKEKVRKR
jgi:hypothetical protein